MAENDLWRDRAMKSLVVFLSSARIEDYDAVAYDLECDFDPSNIDAVRYIACNAVAKARPIIMEKVGAQHALSPSDVRFVFPIQHMPTDGSVAKFGTDDGNETVQMMRRGRLTRENYTEGATLYVPDATKYYKLILRVLYEPRYIADEDRTDEELRTLIAQEREDALCARKSDRREKKRQLVMDIALIILITAALVLTSLYIGLGTGLGILVFGSFALSAFLIYLAKKLITGSVDSVIKYEATMEEILQDSLHRLDERLERLNKREECSER